MHKKRWDYANEVKTKFVPKIDPLKQFEMKKKEE